MSSIDDNAPSHTLVPTVNVTRSPNWHIAYCNVVGLGWAETEARLMVGFDMDPMKPSSNVREELMVVMPHRAAKMLAHTLGLIINNYEALNGPIPIPADKLAEVENVIKAQTGRAKPVP